MELCLFSSVSDQILSSADIMSSDTLLEEIRATLGPVKPGYLKNSNKEDLNSIIVAEQVRISSLRRHNELVNKLASELPNRVRELEAETDTIRGEQSELENMEKVRARKIEELILKSKSLETQFNETSKHLKEKLTEEAFSIFQKDELMVLLDRIIELRRQVNAPLLKAGGRDAAVLAARIDFNGDMLREISDRLNQLSG
jgi:hypothetical protein